MAAAAAKLPSRIPRALLARSFSVASASAPAPAPAAVDLTDTRRLFASVPTPALLRSFAILSAMAAGPLVDLGTSVINRASSLSPDDPLRSAAFAAARATVHRHFCAGEGVNDAARLVRAMWAESGLRSILDYGMEDALDGAACNRNLAGFHHAIDTASSLPPATASVCIKITAICPISLLERVSDLLRWQQKYPQFPLPWRTHSFPVLCDTSPLNTTSAAPPPLTVTEDRELQCSLYRLSDICESCRKSGVPLLIDAEYSSVQPAIDYFTYAAALEFNDGGRPPLVYGTIQTYLKDSRERLASAVEAAGREGISLGVKLVRGAYLARESRLAFLLDVPSPIHSSIEETHRCFDDCAAFMLEKASRGTDAVVIATHNVESAKMLAAKAEELGMRKDDQKLQFAQLMGMADALSLGLKNAGFHVSKYLPFGPVEQVVPYLVRRAQENRGLLSSTNIDRQLIRKELLRRLAPSIGRIL